MALPDSQSIFKYSSALEYLQAVFRNAKKENPSLTMEKYASRVGIGLSSFKMIITGKRKLTASQIHFFSKALKLSGDERQNFEALTFHDRAKRNPEKNFYKNRSKEIKSVALLENVLIAKKELIADHFIFPILLYLTDIEQITDFSIPFPAHKVEELGSIFGIEKKRLENCLAVISKNCNLSRTKEEKGTHYVFDKLGSSFSQKQYLKSWLKESEKKIDSSYESEDTFFNASSVTISSDKIPMLISDLKGVLEKYISLPVEKRDETILIQSCIQLFPILNSIGSHKM